MLLIKWLYHGTRIQELVLLQTVKGNRRGRWPDKIQLCSTGRNVGVLTFQNIAVVQKVFISRSQWLESTKEKVQKFSIFDTGGNVLGQNFLQEQSSLQINIVEIASNRSRVSM
jgi:hypothetical protein